MPKLQSAFFNIDETERLASGDSPVHRLHPAVKIISSFVLVAAVVSVPRTGISALAPFFFYPAVMTAVAGIPYKPLLKRLAVAMPFSLFGGLTNLIFMRETAFYIGAFAVSDGLLSFISIVLKTLLCVFFLLVLTATTPFAKITDSLASAGVPHILCLQLAMTYRYLSVLTGEAAGMFTAYGLRGGGRGVKITHSGSFAGMLLLRSFERAERIWRAMKCRGCDGVLYTGKKRKLRAADVFFCLLICAAAVLLRIFDFSLLVGLAAR